MKLKNILFYTLLFGVASHCTTKINASCPPQRTISNWRLKIEKLAGKRDYWYGKYILSKPYFQERNVEKGYEDPQWWHKKITAETASRAAYSPYGGRPVPKEYLGTALLNEKSAKYVYESAAQAGNIEVMKSILNKYPSLVDTRLGISRITPLYQAVTGGRKEAVDLLIQKGANPHQLVVESIYAPGYETPLENARSQVKEYEQKNEQGKLANAKEILKTLELADTKLFNQLQQIREIEKQNRRSKIWTNPYAYAPFPTEQKTGIRYTDEERAKIIEEINQYNKKNK